MAVVYASESLSLAALEMLVHCEPALLPGDLVAIPAEIPDALRIHRIDEDALPRSWRRHPAPESLAALGADWLSNRESAVLSVPSAVVPRERNVLLNPGHPDFRKVEVGPLEAFSFDTRLAAR